MHPPRRRKINVVWFKGTDLRVHDHAALQAAHSSALSVLHIYVFDPVWFASTRRAGFPRIGGHRARFQLEAVTDLRERLASAGHVLAVRTHISTASAFEELCQEFDVQKVFAFREICFEEQQIEEEVRRVLHRRGAHLELCYGFELYHEQDLGFDPRRKRFGSFTSFRKTVQEQCSIRPAMPAPDLSRTCAVTWEKGETLPNAIAALGCTSAPASRDPRAELTMRGGETAAIQRVKEYLFQSHALDLDYVGATMTYDPTMSVLKDRAMFKIGAWLAHGCISPRYLYEEVSRYELERGRRHPKSYFLHELLWRDFSRYASMQAGTRIFKLSGLDDDARPTWGWSRDRQRLKAWTEGATGYPYIDAAMRELKATGYFNHMGREVCGWFLVLDLGLDWRLGAEWYESQLIDYEPCANWFNWAYHCARVVTKSAQKARGWECPAALPPMSPLQTTEVLFWGARHDPDALYIKKWIPELGSLPPALTREPWLAMEDSEEKRLAPDGNMYAKTDFLAYYGDENEWDLAGSSAVEDPMAVDSLLAMGFDYEVAMKALKQCGMQVDLAVACLLEGSDQTLSASGTWNLAGFRHGIDYPMPILPPVSQDSEAVAEHAKAEQDKRAQRLAPLRQRLIPNASIAATHQVAASTAPLLSIPADAPKPPRKNRWGRASPEPPATNLSAD